MSSLLQFNTQGVFCGSRSVYSPAFETIGTLPLEGVQSATVSIVYPHQDVPDWAGAGESVQITRPRPQLEINYLFGSGRNEEKIGFIVGAVPIPALFDLNVEKNYYIQANTDYRDLLGASPDSIDSSVVMGAGNCLISQYAFSAGVGQATSASIGLEALNLIIQPSGSGVLPSVYKQSGIYPTGRYVLPAFNQAVSDYFVAQPGSIVLTFDSGCAFGAQLSGNNACPIQSFNFGFNVQRQDIKDFGWAFPDHRPVVWPLTLNISANARLNGYQMDTLNRFLCTDSGWNFNVGFKNDCGSIDGLNFVFQGAKLENQSFVTRIGQTNEVSFGWSVKIFDVNRTTGSNFFIQRNNGCFDHVIFSGVDYGAEPGQTPLRFDLSGCCFLTVLNGTAVIDRDVVYVSDEAGPTTVRASLSGTAEYADIAINVS